ncbi:MAG: hypothetical protein M1832_006397 [Thelocarpon impressellum]|nr:MAG: hypothetical protein M1832_006397 [Thelocarpon impressellum]
MTTSLAGHNFDGGFSENLFEALKQNSDAEKEMGLMLTKFARKVEPFAAISGKPSVSEVVGDKFSLRRKIIVDGGGTLDKKKLLSLHRLFLQDQKDGVVRLAAVNDHPDDPEDPIRHRDQLHRCAVRSKILNESETFAIETGLVKSVIGFPVQATSMLEDFFVVCQYPNAAEVELLSEVTSLDEESINEWLDDFGQGIQHDPGRSQQGNGAVGARRRFTPDPGHRAIAVSTAFERPPEAQMAGDVPAAAATTVVSLAAEVEHLGDFGGRRVTGAVGRSHLVASG